MIRSPLRLVIIAGLAAAPGGAAAAAVGPQPPACTFNPSKVTELASPDSPPVNPPPNFPAFDAAIYGACDVSGSSCDHPPLPSAANQINLPSTALADIEAAFSIAPNFFQKELCDLDHIYIDTYKQSMNPTAWGIRERLYPADPLVPRTKHVGISATVWSTLAGSSSPPYTTYENYLFNALLAPVLPAAANWVSNFSYSASPDPASSSSPSNANAVAMLALLGHEMGHIIWWDKNVQTITKCTKATRPQFSLYSWPSGNVAHGFRRLGQQDAGNHTSEGPDLQTIALDLRFDSPPNSRNYPSAFADLRTIYGSGNWASLFATVSVDEDFIETFKLWVLTDTTDAPPREPITALYVTLPPPVTTPPTPPAPIDIISRLKSPRTKLAAKVQWIQRCLTWP